MNILTKCIGTCEQGRKTYYCFINIYPICTKEIGIVKIIPQIEWKARQAEYDFANILVKTYEQRYNLYKDVYLLYCS